jgi:tRNA threonylcarbamoyladenosine biosynthesis protein TsaB
MGNLANNHQAGPYSILAIETSCEEASVAVWIKGECLEQRLPRGGNTHSAALLPAIRALLAEAGQSVQGLDVIAFGCGPGAFTGVRLACGVAQGLALGAGLPVAAISSLQALAWPFAAQHRQLYCAADARMSEVYCGLFELRDGIPQAQGEICCAPPDALPLPEAGRWQGIGSAFSAYAALLESRLGGHLSVLDAQAVPCARSVAELAARAPQDWLDAALAAPDYVRNRIALTTAERLAAGGRA